MIVRATIRGEPDMPAFTKVFEYGSADVEIFFSSAGMIDDRLRSGMKLNANEALVLYCSYVVKAILAGEKDEHIQAGASKLLDADSAMVGVPETLRAIELEVKTDGRHARNIVISEPLSVSKNLLVS